MAQRNLPLRQPRHLRIMRHHHDRVSIAMQILQQLRHNRLIRRIQIPRRLIRQQNRRIINLSAATRESTGCRWFRQRSSIWRWSSVRSPLTFNPSRDFSKVSEAC